VFVRDSKVNVRQHAHRESDPFLCDKKNGSIPTSLNRRGMYSHKKTNARLFLFSSMVFILKSSERVLVLRESLKCSRLEPLVAELHRPVLGPVFGIDRSPSAGVPRSTSP
jgi:hypothetical protein